eukprot:2795549-Pleurochrysis_carterae.AAC.2
MHRIGLRCGRSVTQITTCAATHLLAYGVCPPCATRFSQLGNCGLTSVRTVTSGTFAFSNYRPTPTVSGRCCLSFSYAATPPRRTADRWPSTHRARHPTYRSCPPRCSALHASSASLWGRQSETPHRIHDGRTPQFATRLPADLRFVRRG